MPDEVGLPQSKMTESERRRELYLAVKSVFGSPEGRIVLDWLKAQVHHGRAFLVPGDPCMTHFHLGRQDPINSLVAILETPIDQLVPPEAETAGLPTNDPMFSPAKQLAAVEDTWGQSFLRVPRAIP